MKILKNEKASLALMIAGIVLTIVGIVFFLWAESNLSTSEKIDASKFGQLGDFVGGIVGSIWSLAGVILFYIALNEQRNDFKTNQNVLNLQVEALNHQIREFEFQRKELESSRKVYEEQSKTQRFQQFESNFYSLLNVYLTIKNNLNNFDVEKDYFKSQYNKLVLIHNPDESFIVNHNLLVAAYVDIYNDDRGHLSHYFKTFYRIIKIIDSIPGFSYEEKFFYSKILRSQLTDYENLILYYNSHSIYGVKSRSLILKYNLLKHTPLFKIPTFSMYGLKQDNTILFFAEYLHRFLSKHIQEYYELESDVTSIEENCDYFSCIIGIYFGDKIEIKVHCNKEITHNNIQLTEGEFGEFLLYFLEDKVIFNNYLERDLPRITKFLTNIGDSKIFGVQIDSELTVNINTDKF